MLKNVVIKTKVSFPVEGKTFEHVWFVNIPARDIFAFESKLEDSEALKGMNVSLSLEIASNDEANSAEFILDQSELFSRIADACFEAIQYKEAYRSQVADNSKNSVTVSMTDEEMARLDTLSALLFMGRDEIVNESVHRMLLDVLSESQGSDKENTSEGDDIPFDGEDAEKEDTASAEGTEEDVLCGHMDNLFEESLTDELLGVSEATEKLDLDVFGLCDICAKLGMNRLVIGLLNGDFRINENQKPTKDESKEESLRYVFNESAANFLKKQAEAMKVNVYDLAHDCVLLGIDEFLFGKPKKGKLN